MMMYYPAEVDVKGMYVVAVELQPYGSKNLDDFE
jgi:hypothetical protein